MIEQAASVVLAVGLCTYYSPGVMEEVVARRLKWGQLDLVQDHVGYAALAEAHHIDRTVWVVLPDGRQVGPLLVVDCSKENHRERQKQRGWAVDLDWETWHELGLPRKPLTGCTVWSGKPRRVSGGVY